MRTSSPAVSGTISVNSSELAITKWRRKNEGREDTRAEQMKRGSHICQITPEEMELHGIHPMNQKIFYQRGSNYLSRSGLSSEAESERNSIDLMETSTSSLIEPKRGRSTSPLIEPKRGRSTSS